MRFSDLLAIETQICSLQNSDLIAVADLITVIGARRSASSQIFDCLYHHQTSQPQITRIRLEPLCLLLCLHFLATHSRHRRSSHCPRADHCCYQLKITIIGSIAAQIHSIVTMRHHNDENHCPVPGNHPPASVEPCRLCYTPVAGLKLRHYATAVTRFKCVLNKIRVRYNLTHKVDLTQNSTTTQRGTYLELKLLELLGYFVNQRSLID
ncbi:hypothetical protein Acr_00g0068780 [Actinidia rufa]|uniref:Uncharacterized protein n=1 Tax=Actinidia rufa TaxID=165716 RepID=A0A7J0DRC8_9ERIC|nr:hypothetical protein Acr_00g0068780 [Actinidia rufa]